MSFGYYQYIYPTLDGEHFWSVCSRNVDSITSILYAFSKVCHCLEGQPPAVQDLMGFQWSQWTKASLSEGVRQKDTHTLDDFHWFLFFLHFFIFPLRLIYLNQIFQAIWKLQIDYILLFKWMITVNTGKKYVFHFPYMIKHFTHYRWKARTHIHT